jgi:hypothetical protein
MKASMPASAKAAIVPFGKATTVAPAGDGLEEVLLDEGGLMEAKDISQHVGTKWKMSEDPLVRDERLKASDGQ